MSDTLNDIADAAEALCSPRHNAEPRHTWDANRNRKPLPPHLTIVPGLIQQLREYAEEGTAAGDDMGVKSVPDSRPPGAFDAVALIAAIEFGSAWRLGQLGLPARGKAEANISAIVGAAGRTHSDDQAEIRAELRSWRHQSEVILGWTDPPITLTAPCPVEDIDGTGRPCRSRGLVVQADGLAARCVACGTRWDEREVQALLRYAADHMDRSKASADAARLKVRQAKEAEREALEKAREARRNAA